MVTHPGVRRRRGASGLAAALSFTLVSFTAGCSAGSDDAVGAPSPGGADPVEAMAQVQQFLDGLDGQPLLEDWQGTGAVAVSYAGQRAGIDEDSVILSASAAKAYWVAAAAYLRGAAAVQPYAVDIFNYSDNEASGRVIGLVGIDRVNEWTRGIGMDSTYLAEWLIGGGHSASDRQTYGDLNVTTVDDAVTFLDWLVDQSQAGDATAQQVLEWMRLTPDRFAAETSYGGALVHELPLDVAREASHKAGWLLPGAASAVESSIIGIGVIPLPDGGTYSVAIEAQDGARWYYQAAGVARVSLGIYEILAGVTSQPVLVRPTLPTPAPRPSASRSSGTSPEEAPTGGSPTTSVPTPTPSSTAPAPTSSPTAAPSTSSPPPSATATSPNAPGPSPTGG